VVGTPLAVEVDENDPQGGVEHVTDQLTSDWFEVVAVNGRFSPTPAAAEVGEIVTVTGEEPPQPNSATARDRQSIICGSNPRRPDFIKHLFPKNGDSRGTVVGCAARSTANDRGLLTDGSKHRCSAGTKK
jgi:hypothetical protein